MQQKDLAAECTEGRVGLARVVLAEVGFGAGGGGGGVVQVVVEGVLKGHAVCAEGPALLLEAHDDGLTGVVVEEVEEGEEDFRVGVARVHGGVVDLYGVVDEAAPDVEVAHAGVQLGREVVVLALEDLIGEVVGEGVVSARDGEGGEVGLIRDGLHPFGVVGLVDVEGVVGFIAAVAVVLGLDEAGG